MTFSDNLVKKIQDYTPPPRASEILEATPIVLLVGITAAGKDTVLNEVLRSPDFHFLVSHTTRPPRPNNGVMEQDGVAYHFIDTSIAEEMIDKKAFIEVNFFSNKIYGTSIAEVEKARQRGKIAISDIEVQGVDDYMRLSSKVRPIFILPPDYDTWQARFMRRYGDHAEQYAEDIARRLRENESELEFALQKDYFLFVINDKLTDCVRQVGALARGQSQTAAQKRQAKEVIQQLLMQLRAKIRSSEI